MIYPIEQRLGKIETFSCFACLTGTHNRRISGSYWQVCRYGVALVVNVVAP